MDLKRELEIVRRTGKYLMGIRQTYLSILNNKAKVVVLAKTCPEDERGGLRAAAKMRGIKLIESSLEPREIGIALGKPFGAAAIAITDAGSSTLLEGVEEG